MTIFRRIKNAFKNSLRKIWEFGQNFNLDILPHHYYSILPMIKDLKKEQYWKKPYSMYGVKGIDIKEQLTFGRECCAKKYLQDVMEKQDIYNKACQSNGEGGFGPIEADFLFCFIYSKKPKKIIQIGCGLSTAVILMAAKSAHYQPKIICIDPYPNQFLKKAAQEHKIILMAQKAEKLSLNLLTNLDKGDLFFVDSTHAAKPGSEVQMIITEVLPRLPKGCFIQYHDITFPYNYPRHLLTTDLFIPNESNFLYTFLVNNSHLTIRISLSMLHYFNRSGLKKLLPNYKPATDEFGLEKTKGHFPSSTYLQII